MTRNDLEYFLERAITERELAKAARNPNAVAAHEELAMRYDALIKKLARPFRHAVITSRVVLRRLRPGNVRKSNGSHATRTQNA